jgi:hypothetical protein
MKLEAGEAGFQAAVVELAQLCGWQCMHVRRSIARDGQWATATSVPGWPDLVAFRPGQLLFIELKAERGRLSVQQRDVLDALTAAGADVRIWKPSDWPAIETTLRSRWRPLP